MKDTFFILDGHSQIYRYHYAKFHDLTSPSGEPTKATYLFISYLLKLCQERKPAYLALALDSGREFLKRREVYADYKANRGEVNEVVMTQTERIKQITKLLGIATFQMRGYEADDIIATLARGCVSDDVDVVVVSRDKDLEQLLDDPRIHMYDPLIEEYITPEMVLAKRGVLPHLRIDQQVLVGDETDNVPGIDGWGAKTAAKYLNQYDGLGHLMLNIEDITPKLQENLCKARELGHLSRNRALVTLQTDVPLMINGSELEFNKLNMDACRGVFKELAFKRWI